MFMRHSLIAAGVLAFATVARPALADIWTVDQQASSLGFEVAQGDGKIAGSFGSWQADIDFDPAAPEKAAITATIDTASASTGSPQFDGMLPGADFFDTANFAKAVFQSDKVSALGGDAYRAEGTLTIRDISQPVTLEFTLKITGDTAVADGTATLSRSAHQVGASVAASSLADAVTVSLSLTATR